MVALQALFNLGNLQRQCGEFEAAIANYEGVLEISPDHWRGLLNYSVALVGVGRHEEAKRALRRAFKLSGAASACRYHPKSCCFLHDMLGLPLTFIVWPLFGRRAQRSTRRPWLASL